MNAVQLIRYGSIPGMGTFGSLRANGFSCVTLEREWMDNAADISCIPLGQYTCSLYDSPKHGKVYQVTGVQNRANIEIHAANVMQELLGCIALGQSFTSMATPKTMGKVMWAINGSQMTVSAFMAAMGGEDFVLSIERAM